MTNTISSTPPISKVNISPDNVSLNSPPSKSIKSSAYGFAVANVGSFFPYYTFRYFSPKYWESLSKTAPTFKNGLRCLPGALRESCKDSLKRLSSGGVSRFVTAIGSESILLAVDMTAEQSSVNFIKNGDYIKASVPIALTTLTLPLEVNQMGKPPFSAPSKAWGHLFLRQVSAISTIAIGESIGNDSNFYSVNTLEKVCFSWGISMFGTVQQNKFLILASGLNNKNLPFLFNNNRLCKRSACHLAVTAGARSIFGLGVGAALTLFKEKENNNLNLR